MAYAGYGYGGAPPVSVVTIRHRTVNYHHHYHYIMEKTEAGLRGLCIREIDVKSQILVTKYGNPGV